MAITYSLGYNPKWYVADLTGKPLAGGYLGTFSSLVPGTLKLVYQDAAGVFPYPYVTIPNVGSLGILFDENGTQGPFYFQFNSGAPNDLYYLEVYDSDGVLQWTIDNFTPAQGGGGSIITTALSLENLITNSVMWRNTGVTPINTSSLQFLKVAPGAHAALAQTVSNAGPDICFIKNGTGATDSIAFPRFALGSTPFLTAGDVTPVDYFEYACSVGGTGESFKYVQYPITSGVQNLTNQPVTVSIWAKSSSGAQNLTLKWFQFFGDGVGATADNIIPIQVCVLSATWTKFTAQVVVPDISALSPLGLGVCGNSGLFVQVWLPLDAAVTIDFTKPSLYLGNVTPEEDYSTYDMIDAQINAPRTGYVYGGYDLVAPYGYVFMNDGTIGSAASIADTKGTDTFPLYNLLWNNISSPSANTLCVVSGGALGASAIADFSANRTLQIPKALGRAMSGSGAGSGLSTFPLGDFTGVESVALDILEMPSHSHDSTAGTGGFVQPQPGGNIYAAGNVGVIGGITNTGGGQPHENIQPTTYLNYYIKL